MQAFASCGSDKTLTKHVQLNNINIGRDTPIGAEIFREDFPMGESNSIILHADGNSHCVLSSNLPSQLSPNVYSTNIPGVGFKLEGVQGFQDDFSPGIDLAFRVPRAIVFIKTGVINESLLSLSAISFYITDSKTGIQQKVMDIVVSGSMYIAVQKCTVSNNSLLFSLGDINRSEFTTRIGSISSHSISQDLHLECDANTNVGIILRGNQNRDISDSSVLALNNSGSQNMADGVGVQLLYNNMPLHINSSLVMKRATNIHETFPITARFYQTKTSVKAGDVSATATLEIIYQ